MTIYSVTSLHLMCTKYLSRDLDCIRVVFLYVKGGVRSVSQSTREMTGLRETNDAEDESRQDESAAASWTHGARVRPARARHRAAVNIDEN